MAKRTNAEVRKEEILTAGLEIAKASGLAAVSGRSIAAALGVTRTTVMYHISSMPVLRRDIMRLAIKAEELAVIAEGLATGSLIAKNAPEALRRRAAEGLIG